MYVLIPLTVAVALFGMQLYSYRKFRNIITLFSVEDSLFSLLNQYFIGVNLKESLIFPTHFSQTPTIVMFAAPSCDTCHHEVERYLTHIKKKTTNLPFLCAVKQDDSDYQHFIDTFSGKITMVPVDKKTMSELQIINFPSLFIVDSQGIIRYVGRSVGELVDILKHKEKQKLHNIQ